MSQMKAQIDKLLTDVSNKYEPQGLICEKLLPSIQSAQYSGKLGLYGTSHLRIENSLKGGRGKYRMVEARQYSTTSYYIEGHGLSDVVSKEDYRNVEDPFQAESDTSEGISMMLFLEKEKLLADTLTNTGIITQSTTLSGSSQFSDYANSDPIGVFNVARAAILDGCGKFPNVAAMDIKVWNQLRFHPAMLDALGFKYSRPGGLSENELSMALGVERLLIADARYESAKEGQSSSLSPVWGKDIVFCVAPQSASKKQISVGYLVKLAGGNPRKVYKEMLFNPPGASEILVEDEYDMLISQAAAAYVVKAAIA